MIGKLANRFRLVGKKVLVAAADTFRAAAEEQLDIWAKRAGADIVRRDRADAASVVYEAIEKAKAENYDVVLVDTAGRLQNKFRYQILARIKQDMEEDTINYMDSIIKKIEEQPLARQVKIFFEINPASLS